MWRGPWVVRRVRKNTCTTSIRSLGRLSVSNNYGSARRIHNTCRRQTPNLHALIAERLKQYVDPNGAKPTRTYADRLGKFDPSPSKRVNERRSTPHHGNSTTNRLPANKSVDSDAHEHLRSVVPRSRRHQPRQRSERPASPRNSSDAASYNIPHNSPIGAYHENSGSNRFASAAKSSRSTAGGQATKMAPQARHKTQKDRTPNPSDRVPDAFELNFSTARRDGLTMKPLENEVEQSPTTYPPSDSGRQPLHPDRRVEEPKPVNEASIAPRGDDSVLKPLMDELDHSSKLDSASNSIRQHSSQLERQVEALELRHEANTAAVKDSLATKALSDELKTSQGPGREKQAVPHKKASPEDRKAYSELKSWATDSSLPKWGPVRTPRSMSRMLDRLDDTLSDGLPLYCDLVTDSHPHVMLIYTPKHQLLYQVDIAELGHHDAFERTGSDSRHGMSLARILREQQHQLFFHDVRKAAGVLCGFYGMHLDGVSETQVLQATPQSASERKNLKDSVTDYLLGTDQSLESYQSLLSERDTACQQHKEKDIMSQLRLPAVRNVYLYQLSLMPRLFDYYRERSETSDEQGDMTTRRRIAQAKWEHERDIAEEATSKNEDGNGGT